MKNKIDEILNSRKPEWYKFYKKISNINHHSTDLPIPEWDHIYYKAYARMPKVELPAPAPTINKNLTRVLLDRKSKRNFSKKKLLSLDKMSSLLYYSLGINPEYKTNFPHRFYPSGGARYPIETYLLCTDVSGLQQAIYHYYIKDHVLEKLFEYKKEELNRIFLHNFPINASCIIVMTGILQRTTIKYGDRGYNYALIEIGHIAQNIYLLASALNINCCAIGGYKEKYLSSLLDLDTDEEIPLYTLAIQ